MRRQHGEVQQRVGQAQELDATRMVEPGRPRSALRRQRIRLSLHLCRLQWLQLLRAGCIDPPQQQQLRREGEDVQEPHGQEADHFAGQKTQGRRDQQPSNKGPKHLAEQVNLRHQGIRPLQAFTLEKSWCPLPLHGYVTEGSTQLLQDAEGGERRKCQPAGLVTFCLQGKGQHQRGAHHRNSLRQHPQRHHFAAIRLIRPGAKGWVQHGRRQHGGEAPHCWA
mmetsp:Transcript_13436/g.29594  ORF Transcript_13436/g.29594 Transcript_13436/m.29594 type:complete len:222 (-) Transcript_13436:118-783(-)